MDAAEFRDVLREIGWSASELARRLGIRPGSVFDWLNGRNAVPENLAAWLRRVRDAQGSVPPLPDNWRR
jgi:plasmid maintenance system antidote protein VapI